MAQYKLAISDHWDMLLRNDGGDWEVVAESTLGMPWKLTNPAPVCLEDVSSSKIYNLKEITGLSLMYTSAWFSMAADLYEAELVSFD